MSNIKVGDIVELKYGNPYQGKLQNKVTSISDCGGYVRVNDMTAGTRVGSFKVVETSKHHKHHDLIITWAKGAEIEYLSATGTWTSTKQPSWSSHKNYRIKSSEPTELEKLIKEHKAMGEAIDKLTKEIMNE